MKPTYDFRLRKEHRALRRLSLSRAAFWWRVRLLAAKIATAILPALLLSSCGGGGAGGVYDPVVRIRFVDVPPPANALTYFDKNGTRRIEVDYSLEGDPTLPDVLRHELWHAVVGVPTHNPDPACVSSSPAPSVFIACPVEAAEMRAATANGYVEVSFPEAEQAISEAVFWWNWSCGAAVLRVAD